MSAPALEAERPPAGETLRDEFDPEKPILDDGIGDRDEEGYDGDGGRSEDDGAGADGGPDGGASPEDMPLSDERRDRVILRTVAILVAGWVVLMAAVLIAGAVGWIQPVCGGIFVTQTAGCDRSAPSYVPSTSRPWQAYTSEGLSVTVPITTSQPGAEIPR